MATIADKFGRPSIPTDYALATTVKTARTVGEAVLACYDLSNFALDTPVYFITYKKTVDPVTGTVSVTNQTSWKALVNPDNNTLTNLTLAPGYTDIGNDIGDFVECVPTSFWGNSLVDALLGSLNPDGTMKTSAVQTALNISGTPTEYVPLATLPSSIVNNGQRSYSIIYPGVDYSDRLSPGARYRTVRTNAAPTQSTSLNGTNQYWSRPSVSVSGMTFTDDFVAGAWVKLSSYPSGEVNIMSRYNGTSGWRLFVGANGTVQFYGINGGSSNVSGMYTYQSLPLNKWVHISAQMDMSAFTSTSTTMYVMFDGVEVPIGIFRGGTNPIALVQAGNLEVGSANGTGFFPGKIDQAFVSSAKITQATLRGYMSQGLTGTEPNLISAYSFSGNANDLKVATANNLTANNGATATNADSPFGGQAGGAISSTIDYGIVQKVSYTAPDTTVIVQVPEGCTIPTVGGVDSTSYSTAKSPYGFPGQRDKWRVAMLTVSGVTVGGALGGTSTFPVNLPTPVGEWTVGYDGNLQHSSTSATVNAEAFFWMGTNPTYGGTPLIPGFLGAWLYIQGGSYNYVLANVSRSTSASLLTATTYNMYYRPITGSGTVSGAMNGNVTFTMYADNALL